METPLHVFFEINLKTILLTVYKLIVRALRLDGAKKVQRKSVSKKASKKFAKEQDLEKAVNISLTQRDIARTYVLPRETELSRTFLLSDKQSLANSDILRNSSEGNQVQTVDSNNNNNSPPNIQNSENLKNSGNNKLGSNEKSVGSAEMRELQQKADEQAQKQNDKKKKVKNTVLEFGKSKKH
jgi:hypothetical protein